MKVKKMTRLFSTMLATVLVLGLMPAAVVNADTASIYSSTIPDGLRLEMVPSADKARWAIIKDGTTVGTNVGDKSQTGSTNATYVSTAKKPIATYHTATGNDVEVGLLKNTMMIAKATANANATGYDIAIANGASAINIQKSLKENQTEGYTAVITTVKWDYSVNYGYKDPKTTLTWGDKAVDYSYDSCYDNFFQNTGKSRLTTTDFNKYYYVAGVEFGKNVQLDEMYFALVTKGVDASDTSAGNKRAIWAVPANKYITRADLGKYVEVAIPMSEFALGTAIAEYYDNNVLYSSGNTVTAPDTLVQSYGSDFIGAGLMRKYNTNSVSTKYGDGLTDATAIIVKQQLVGVDPVTNLTSKKVEDHTPNGTGFGEMITFTPPKNQVTGAAQNHITGYEIALKESDGTVIASKLISVDDEKLIKNADGTLSYSLGVFGKKGSLICVRAVAGETVGNSTIGYTPVYSEWVSVANKWQQTTTGYKIIHNYQGGVGKIAVVNRQMYNKTFVIAHYAENGIVKKVKMIDSVFGGPIGTTYEGTDTVKIFVFEGDGLSITPFIECSSFDKTTDYSTEILKQ